jgi:D-amino-acid dehydrogenase
MNQSKSATIVGGGVIGAFCAYYLMEKGWAVTIIDKERFGQGSSSGNCGLIVPNHILPLNDPDNLLKAIFWMLKKDAPLHVKPQFNPGLIKWFVNFARRCNRKDIFISARGRHALLQSSFKRYPAIIENEKIACEWTTDGTLHVYRSGKKSSAYNATDAVLRQYGIAAEQLDRKDIVALAPALDGDLSGGWYYRDTAHLRPDRLLHEMHRLLSEKGVRILENRKVTGFVTRENHAVGVRTESGIISASDFVIATGAWTPMFEKALGCRIPIQPGKGFSITMKRPRNCPGLPMIFEEESVVATPWQSGFRLGGTMEFAGYDPSLNRQRLDALTRAAVGYLRGFKAEGIEEEWCGFRPMTYDGLPIIDRSTRLTNVMIAAGHNMVGLSMGPGTGKLVAEMLNNDPPHIDPRPYRADRFGP